MSTKLPIRFSMIIWLMVNMAIIS